MDIKCTEKVGWTEKAGHFRISRDGFLWGTVNKRAKKMCKIVVGVGDFTTIKGVVLDNA